MSRPSPAQPNQAQYPLSALYLFPLYLTRAAYQQATGKQAPPFNPSLPIKTWADPNPDGTVYDFFDPTAGVLGYVNTFEDAAISASQVNLPGPYNYPPYVSPPTDAMQMGPFGPMGLVNPNVVSNASDVEELVSELQAVYPPGTVIQTEIDPSAGAFSIMYGQDPRRAYLVLITVGPLTVAFNAQTLIESKYLNGVGYPGRWDLPPAAKVSVGMQPEFGPPTFLFDAPVIVAPPNALTDPIPIRPLLPNEKIVELPPGNPLFGTSSWVVERTDLTQATPPQTASQQLSSLAQQMQALQQMMAAIQAKLGA
jgi:hypothetical protein